MEELLEILKFEIKDLTKSELEYFASLWTISKKVNRNSLLFPKGRAENYIYFILNGSMKICYEVDDQEIIVGFGYDKTFIFDLPSFFTGNPSNFYIEALKSTNLIGINKTDFYSFLDSNLTFSKFWRTRTELLILDLVEREIDILTNSPIKRYERLKNRNSQIFQKIPNKHIASYLRMKPETLSRLKKTLI